jgi:hypothetical protein
VFRPKDGKELTSFRVGNGVAVKPVGTLKKFLVPDTIKGEQDDIGATGFTALVREGHETKAGYKKDHQQFHGPSLTQRSFPMGKVCN